MNQLYRATVVGWERSAEDLVASDDLVDAGLERFPVEQAPHAQRESDVVGGAPRLELIQEPQPALLKGQREHQSTVRQRHWALAGVRCFAVHGAAHKKSPGRGKCTGSFAIAKVNSIIEFWLLVVVARGQAFNLGAVHHVSQRNHNLARS